MNHDRENIFPLQLPAGNRAYFFDVKGSGEGNRYLLIGETRQTRDGYDEQRILVHEENLTAFFQAFEHMVSVLETEDEYIEQESQTDQDEDDHTESKAQEDQSEDDKAYDLQEIRRDYPRAYMKWSQEEDDQLEALYASGETVKNLAVHFERKPGAIRSRLKKLGLDRPRYG